MVGAGQSNGNGMEGRGNTREPMAHRVHQSPHAEGQGALTCASPAGTLVASKSQEADAAARGPLAQEIIDAERTGVASPRVPAKVIEFNLERAEPPPERAETRAAVTKGTPHGPSHTPRMSWVKVAKLICAELNAAGISRGEIAREAIKGITASVLRWGGTYALFNVAVEALVDRSPVFLACAGAWAVMNYCATRIERSWSNAIQEFSRRFGNYLNLQLLKKHGLSSLEQLNNPDYKAEKELQAERVQDVESIVTISAGVPSEVIPLGLSVYVLLSSANWSTAAVLASAIALAVVPLIRTNFRQAREDVDLEERQSKRSNIVDKIMEGAYSTLGSARMIVGRMTGKVAGIVKDHQDAIDRETTEHERRQVRELRWPDRVFYGSIVAGLGAVGYKVLTGGIGIGDAVFSTKLLTELGDEMEEHGRSAEQYKTALEKVRRFYEFVKVDPDTRAAAVPAEYQLSFENASFVRGEEGASFTAYLPNCSLEKGDLVVIHGASGAGKTTLIKHLAFGCQPATGTITVGGVPLETLAPAEWLGDIRYCAATPSLQEGFTVAQALSLDPEGERYLSERINHPLVRDLIGGLTGGVAKYSVPDSSAGLTRAGLATVIGEGLENSREFSTGELQRLALVMALVPPPKVLFLDEVSSNQSDDFVRILRDSIEAARKAGTIVLFATHSKFFDDQASVIIKISKGRSALVEDSGPPVPVP